MAFPTYLQALDGTRPLESSSLQVRSSGAGPRLIWRSGRSRGVLKRRPVLFGFQCQESVLGVAAHGWKGSEAKSGPFRLVLAAFDRHSSQVEAGKGRTLSLNVRAAEIAFELRTHLEVIVESFPGAEPAFVTDQGHAGTPSYRRTQQPGLGPPSWAYMQQPVRGKGARTAAKIRLELRSLRIEVWLANGVKVLLKAGIRWAEG